MDAESNPSLTIPSRRTVLVGAAATVGSAVLTPTLWVPASAASAPSNDVHLAFGADPQREMNLTWSTPVAVKRPTFEYGTDRSLGRKVTPRSTSARKVTSIYHHVRLTRLKPDTRYYWRINHAGGGARTGSFTTAPTSPRAFRFAAFGDMGVNAKAAANMKVLLQRDPDFAFVVGDLCYADPSGGTGIPSGGVQDFKVWDKWLKLIQPSARSAPWMTTVGNHEMETGNGELGYDGYLQRFTLPGNGARHAPTTYSFVYGNVGFVALDGNDASLEIDRNRGYLGTAQDAWLAARLKSLRADPAVDFIVVGFHNCMYSSNLVHGSDNGCRARWEPLFDRYSVDLVVNGHNHCYERTHLLRDGKITANAPQGAVVNSAAGTTYVTAGGAGQAAYPTGGLPVSHLAVEGGLKVPELALWSALTYLDNSLAFVDVTPRNSKGVATMTLTAARTDGGVVDKITLRRTRK